MQGEKATTGFLRYALRCASKAQALYVVRNPDKMRHLAALRLKGSGMNEHFNAMSNAEHRDHKQSKRFSKDCEVAGDEQGSRGLTTNTYVRIIFL